MASNAGSVSTHLAILLTPGEHYQRSAMASFRLDKLVPCRFSYSLLTPGEHYQRSAMASFRLDKLVPM